MRREDWVTHGQRSRLKLMEEGKSILQTDNAAYESCEIVCVECIYG